MKKIIYYMLIGMTVCNMLRAQEYLTIGMASRPVVADGIIDSKDPWDSVWIKQLKITQFSSTMEMESEFQLKYDSSNLYFAVKVKDATRWVGNSTTYLNDCVVFYIAMDTASELGGYKMGDNSIRLQAIADPAFYSGRPEGGVNGLPEHGKFVCVDNVDNYVQEWILPWAEITFNSGPIETRMNPPWDGMGFKFDVGTTDATDDGLRTELIFWNDNSDLQWNNTNHFGYVSLSTPLGVNTKSSQEIIFNELPVVFTGSENIFLSGYSTSGLQVSYTSSNTNVATVNGNILSITGIGSTTITAVQTGNTVFNPAAPVSRELVVNSSGSNQVKLIIPFTENPPLIDGMIDSDDLWGTAWIKQLQKTTFSTTEEMQSEFQLMYDSVNLYFAARVYDNSRFIANEMNYLNDCVWLFIAMDSTSGSGEYKAGDRHLSLRAVSDPAAEGGSIEFIRGGGMDGQFVCIDSGNFYIQEWKMPWSELADGMSPSWDGKGLKIDVGTGDVTAEGQRTQLMFWNDNSDLQWNNTTHFGYVVLNTKLNDDNRLDQYINWSTMPELTIGDDDVELTAWSTSGLPIEYSTSDSGVATIINNKIHITGIGTVTITASQDGNANFRSAVSVSQRIKIKSERILFDFEKPLADTSWTIFGNGTYQSEWDKWITWNPDQSGINTSQNVLQFIVHYDAMTWVGMYSDDLDEPISITEDTHTFTIMVNKSVISPVMLKIENSPDGGAVHEEMMENTVINEWEKLSFDMSSSIGHTFTRIVILPDFPEIRKDSALVLIDNISLGGIVGLSVEPFESVGINCGENVILNPIINYQGIGELSYSWWPADNLSNSNIPNPVASPQIPTKYTLTVSSEDFGEVKRSVWIYVNPIHVEINEYMGFCGNTFQLGLDVNYQGSGALSYNWLPSSGLSASDIPFPYVNVNSDTWYSVYVESQEGCIAFDSVLVRATGIYSTPTICMVTVNENSNNVVVLNYDPLNQVDSFYIYRESQIETDLYDLIAVLPNSGNLEFIDIETDARVQSYQYKIATIDMCGFESGFSTPHKTIHLTGIGTIGNLLWEPYSGSPIKSYKIYRGTSITDLSQIGSTSGHNISYTDLSGNSGNYLYQVEGILTEPCSALKSELNNSVRSNIFYGSALSDELKTIPEDNEFIFPNPAKDKLNVKAGYSPDARVLIIDMNGKMIVNSQISGQLDITNLSKGIYIVKLIDSKKILINKFIKD